MTRKTTNTENNLNRSITDIYRCYANLSDLSIDDYSASKALSYDSDLEREYAKVNQPSPEEPVGVDNLQLVKYEESAKSTSKSPCTSLFESEKPSKDVTKFSQSVSITYRSPNQQCWLYQLLGTGFVLFFKGRRVSYKVQYFVIPSYVTNIFYWGV